jgi:hypothetical protein
MRHEENYTSNEHCDRCNKRRDGVVYPIAGYMFVCDYCTNPPKLVGIYRTAKIRVALYARKAKYYATTTKAERVARREHFAKAKARINARRAAQGRPLIGESS